MKIFSRGVTKAPKLRKVYFANGEEEGTWYWSDNLNYTIQKVFTDTIGLEYIEDLKLYDYPQLEQLWHGKIPLPENCFTNLKSLVVENCEFLSTVIPCDLLPYFKNLEELQVRSCSSIEQIFDIIDIKTGGILFNLKKLTLERLPKLKSIFFKHSEYLRLSHGPHLEEGSNGKVHRLENCFRNLKTLVVERCDFF
ncbi:hypothetical protein L6164_002727 [Bauhinia variegata]|uniref:Uncharacterized protein n=1 Tax=Bauhinia variegata TaxID=167791 RepID=A0ACB9PZ22_BAUVA|nr:hypothetical protein L6164_002727 [Bauhinia variegata]